MSRYLNEFIKSKCSMCVVCVGDGRTPRTGATFAFRSAFSVLSIDPALKKDYPNIKRLKTLKEKIENCKLDLHTFSAIITMCVHSHASLL